MCKTFVDLQFESNFMNGRNFLLENIFFNILIKSPTDCKFYYFIIFFVWVVTKFDLHFQ